MKKMTTLYKIIFHNRNERTIENKVRDENAWVFTELGVLATRKFDGTSCFIKDNILYKRFDNKKNRKLPIGAIECSPRDEITGHHPHWIICEENDPSSKYHNFAFKEKDNWENGTYELCGEKINKNMERITDHKLIKHGNTVLEIDDWSFDGFKSFLGNNDNNIEGIVFHATDGKMCKLRKSDFGFVRGEL